METKETTAQIEILNEQISGLRKDLEKMAASKSSSEYVGIDEACKILKLSKSSIYKRAASKTIPHYKRGKKLLFLPVELYEYIKGGRVEDEQLPGVTIEK